jgi:hypothetical protein
MEIAKLILEYMKVLAWPITLIGILIGFRKPISLLFSRAKKLDLPGGISLEVFEEKIQEAKELAKKVEKEERTPSKNPTKEIKPLRTDTEANKRMLELGLRPSPSGLQISYYHDLAERDARLALAGLRMDIEIMLQNLAKGFSIKIEERESIGRLNRKLLSNGAITQNQYQLINKMLQIANSAIHGIEINKTQANEVFDIMEILIEDYKSWLSWGFEN